MWEKISDDQKVIGLPNALGDKDKDIKNALEYGRSNLTVEIIHDSFKNRDLELKSEHREALHVEKPLSNPKFPTRGLNNFSQTNYNKDKNFSNRKWGNNKGKGKKVYKGKTKNGKCY